MMEETALDVMLEIFLVTNGGDCGRYEVGYPLFTGESVCSRSNYMTDKCDNNGRGDYDDKTR